ncbi:MAG: DUF4232 domain-containing protein [Acidimicrobiales bacterium]
MITALSVIPGCGVHSSEPSPASRQEKTAPRPPTKKTAEFTPITDVVVVPNVVGQDYGVAQLRLATTGSMGLQVAYRLVHDASVLAGKVVIQSPAAGVTVSSNRTVTLTVSEGPAQAPGAPPCTSRDLRPRNGPSVSEASGQHTLDIDLQNVSRSTCVLDGHPRVSMLDSHGRQLAFRYTHQGDQMTTRAAPFSVYLPPGAKAWVRLNKYRCDIVSTDYAATVILGLPPGDGSFLIPLPAQTRDEYFSYCGEVASLTIAVSPFEPVSMLLSRPLQTP